MADAETETHAGSCHCGAVTFDWNAPVADVIECNCSYCQRKGEILAFGPKDALVVKTGQDQLTEYMFNKHAIHHMFCEVCGVESFGWGAGPDGSEMAAVNVRTLAGVEPWDLKPQRIDGRSF